METFKLTLVDSVEKNEKGQIAATQEEMERAEGSIPVKVILEENQRECAQEIIEFHEMIADFETTYSIEQLNAIVDLTSEDATNHPVREPARKALNPIFAKMNILKSETNITTEKYEELKKQWQILLNAVGTINGGKVDHNR